MPLQNFQYDTIMREYSRRQAQNHRILEEHTAEAYGKIPRLKEIDDEVATLSADKVRRLLNGEEKGTSDLKAAIQELSDERITLLVANGFPGDYLEMPYTCPDCQDTGYIGSRKCTCFKKAEIELLYAQSNLNEILEKENFDSFSFDYYSATIKNEATGLSALETARRAYDTAQRFVQNFDHKFENLFLYGDTGVGKTFLSHCIAKEVMDSSYSVIYFSASRLFDVLAKNMFGKKDEETDDSLDYIYNCDLLIIDDLGTELANTFTTSQLFSCLNERILRRKSTIISTNLALDDIKTIYSERIFSRISSHYTMLRLTGDDIRIQKKLLNLGGTNDVTP